MSYDIPDEMKYREKIVFRMDMKQLCYFCLFAMITFFSYNLPLEGEGKLIAPFFIGIVGVCFILFNLEEKVADIYRFYSGVRKAASSDAKAQRLVGVKSVENDQMTLMDGLLAKLGDYKGKIVINIETAGTNADTTLMDDFSKLATATGGKFNSESAQQQSFVQLDAQQSKDISLVLPKAQITKVDETEYANAVNISANTTATGEIQYNAATRTIVIVPDNPDVAEVEVNPQDIPVKLTQKEPEQKTACKYEYAVFYDQSESTKVDKNLIQSKNEELAEGRTADLSLMTAGSGGAEDYDNSPGSINAGISKMLDKYKLDKGLDSNSEEYKTITAFQKELKKNCTWDKEADFTTLLSMLDDPVLTNALKQAFNSESALSDGSTETTKRYIVLNTDGGDIALNDLFMEKMKYDAGMNLLFFRNCKSLDVGENFATDNPGEVNAAKFQQFMANTGITEMDVGKGGKEVWLKREGTKTTAYFYAEATAGAQLEKYASLSIPTASATDVKPLLGSVTPIENMDVEMPSSFFVAVKTTDNTGQIKNEIYEVKVSGL